MGVELVLSLRLPPLNSATSFCVGKLLPEHGLDVPRRRRCAVAAEARNSGFSSNPEGNSDCRFHGSVDNHHPHHHSHQHRQPFHHFQHHSFHEHHNQLPHPWQGSLDIGRHSGRLGSGFSIAAESDSVDVEKSEHGQSTNSFLHNAKCPSPIQGDPSAVDRACAGKFTIAAVDLPLSLRMLKKKQQDSGKSPLAAGLSEVGNSLLNAFSSVFYMMKTLQSRTLHIQQQFFKQEIEGLLSQVQREMHVSFLWLFQQVFSHTPELMVLVMILLADFTAFSMANNIPLLPISMYTPPVSVASTVCNNVKSSDEGLRAYFDISFKASPSVVDKSGGVHNDGGSVGNGGRRSSHIIGGDDGNPDPHRDPMDLNKALYAVDDNLSAELSSKATESGVSLHEYSASQLGLQPTDFSSSSKNLTPSEFSDMAAAIAFEELMTSENLPKGEALLPASSNNVVHYAEGAGTKEATGISSHLVLDQETMRSLVAPLSARLEDDDYSCYDRTDLAYQVAIRSDTMNSMLLANYAQFLFLVRKDHDRAEELFRKAVLCDPSDCDAISRFASFLWLAQHNLAGAEKAYRAALHADPTNSFHAANYAHFLWNSGL